MIDDRPPDELLDSCLYAIDLELAAKLAALRATVAALKAIDDARRPGVVPADAMAAYVRQIETLVEDAIAAQAAVLRRQLLGRVFLAALDQGA